MTTADLADVETSFNNTGDAKAFPIWKITGPATSIETTSPFGRKWKWTGTLGNEDYLIVDHSKGTVTDQAGVNRYDGLAPAPVFWWIPPGESKGRLAVLGSSKGTLIGDTKALLATNLITNPRGATMATGSGTEVRRNGIINPGMEGSTGWTGIGAVTMTYDTAQKSSGAQSLKLVSGASASTTAAYGTSGTILGLASGRTSSNVPVPSGVAAGDVILLIVYFENTSTSGTITPPTGFALLGSGLSFGTTGQMVYWKRATGADSGTYNVTHASAVTSGVAHRFTGAAPTGTPVELLGSAGSSGTTGSAPAVSGTTTAANELLAYFALTNDFGFTTASNWTPPTGFTERFDTQGFELATKTQASAGATGSLTASNTDTSGNTSAVLVGIKPGAGVAATDYGAQSGSATSQMLPVSPGQSVTASVDIKRVTSEVNFVNVGIQFYNSSGTLLSSPSTSASPTSTAFGRFSSTQTAPASAAFAALYVFISQSSTGVWIDQALLEKASSAGTYFDGSTTDATPVFYDWLGTANASFSTQSVLGPKGWLPHSSVTPVPTQVSNGFTVSFDGGDDGVYFAIPQAFSYGEVITGMFKVIPPVGVTVGVFLWNNATGTASAATQVVGDGTEHTISTTWTLPTSVASGDLRIYLWCYAVTGTKVVTVTGSALIEDDYDGDVFDGATGIVEGGLWHGWTGTPHDSTSEERATVVYGRTVVTAQWTRRKWLVI